MGKVVTGFSTSLDGFIAGPGDDVERLFVWYHSGDTEYKYPGGEWRTKVSPQSAALIQELVQATGALVTGRRQFDNTNAWGGRHPVDAPVFVVTHSVPQEWVGREGSPFTFVTEGVESAVEQAKVVAGGKNVIIDAASIAQQCLKAGLVDELGMDLVPVLLGEGARFFDNLDPEPIELETIKVVEAPGVTHLRFRVVR